jgi:hypothetical protein
MGATGGERGGPEVHGCGHQGSRPPRDLRAPPFYTCDTVTVIEAGSCVTAVQDSLSCTDVLGLMQARVCKLLPALWHGGGLMWGQSAGVRKRREKQIWIQFAHQCAVRAERKSQGRPTCHGSDSLHEGVDVITMIAPCPR